MLRPARMSRILVGGHRDRMREVVETLHDEGVVHLEDYRDPGRVTSIGTPFEEGEAVADLLVRVRGLQRALDVERWPAKVIATEDAAKNVAEAEAACQSVLARQSEVRTRLASLHVERNQLLPLDGLDIDVGAVRRVQAIRTFLGTVREDPSGALSAAGIDHELQIQRTPSGLLAALMVRRDEATPAEKALAEAGFVAVQVPQVEGTPAEALARIEADIAAFEDLQTAVEEDLVATRDKLGSKLAALERHLAQQADQAVAPLQFGVTAHTFHLEGWVPANRLNRLRNVLAHRFGEALYVEELGDAPRAALTAGQPGEGEHGGGHDAPASEDGHAGVAVADEPPTSLQNKGPSRAYEFMLSLMSMPRYREVDPTKLIAFFFPLFFGLMIGDVVIGLFILIFALWLRKGKVFGIGGPGVGTPLMWGAIVAIVVGLFVFGEGLGLHFVVSEEALEEGEFSWESAFGIHFPEEGFMHKVDTTRHAVEGEATNPFAPHGGTFVSVNGWFTLGHYSKVHDVEALLLWSSAIGVVHLILGFLLGVRNVAKGHGVKLAIQEKASWLMIMVAVALLAWGVTAGVAAATWSGAGLFVVAVALLWMGVQATLGVGFVALLELPGLLGNILSYTRLAAIGASKAGMAIAFATIGFELVGGAAGIVVYLFASLLITLLAILSGGLQSLRLQFVEFFSKFYEGGGRPYLPFGRRAA